MANMVPSAARGFSMKEDERVKRIPVLSLWLKNLRT